MNTINKNTVIVRKKRIRTAFLNWQLELLERHFQIQQYLVGEQRIHFAKFLGLNEIQVVFRSILALYKTLTFKDEIFKSEIGYFKI